MNGDSRNEGLPFGLAAEQPVFDRATELAREIFGACAASIALVNKGEIWRTHDPEERLPKVTSLSEQVIATGEPLWLKDLRLDPRAANHPLVTAPNGLRSYIGAPILADDGVAIGALAVATRDPRPFDAAKLGILQKLAHFVADECRRQHNARDLKET